MQLNTIFKRENNIKFPKFKYWMWANIKFPKFKYWMWAKVRLIIPSKRFGSR